MTRAARSLVVFAAYLLVVGGWLLAAPASFLRLFGFPDSPDVWIRVLGMVLLFLSSYYFLAATAEMTRFFRWTVYVRSSVIVFFGLFVWADLASKMLLLFGVVDLVAAAWTAVSLRADAREPATAASRATAL